MKLGKRQTMDSKLTGTLTGSTNTWRLVSLGKAAQKMQDFFPFFFLRQIWNHSWHLNLPWIFYLTQVSQPVIIRGTKKTIFTMRWSNTGTGESPPFDISGTWQAHALRNPLELQSGLSSSWMDLAGGEAAGLVLTAFRGPSPSAFWYGSTTEACLHVWQELSISKESWLLWQRCWVGKYFAACEKMEEELNKIIINGSSFCKKARAPVRWLLPYTDMVLTKIMLLIRYIHFSLHLQSQKSYFATLSSALLLLRSITKHFVTFSNEEVSCISYQLEESPLTHHSARLEYLQTSIHLTFPSDSRDLFIRLFSCLRCGRDQVVIYIPFNSTSFCRIFSFFLKTEKGENKHTEQCLFSPLSTTEQSLLGQVPQQTHWLSRVCIWPAGTFNSFQLTQLKVHSKVLGVKIAQQKFQGPQLPLNTVLMDSKFIIISVLWS